MARCVIAAAVCLLLAATAKADMYLYVDSAPNLYGSPDWAPWWAGAKGDAVAGTFDNMRSGYLGTPGALNAHPYDEIAYKTNDLGHRLHWIYWLPGLTTSELDGKLQVRNVIDWDGRSWTFDWDTYTWTDDLEGKGWRQPSDWQDYAGGVIGSFHYARSAIDNYAAPYDSGGTIDDETDQADVDALAAMILCHQEFAQGQVRLWDDQAGDWGPVEGLTVNSVVPAPAAVLLGALGLAVAGMKLRKFV